MVKAPLLLFRRFYGGTRRTLLGFMGLALILTGHAQEADHGFSVAPIRADAHPDVLTVPADLEHPKTSSGAPRPGVVASEHLPEYEGTDVMHTMCLPPQWTPGGSYPVVVEYLGNTARVRDLRSIGHALCADTNMIWVVLPFVAPDGKTDSPMWWGDLAATVAYAKAAVPSICKRWGGDPSRVALVGSSRGAIACNYIGLQDDEIAGMWRAMVLFSHYDDMHAPWGMPPKDQQLAPERVRRLGSRPQLIAGEHTTIPQPWKDDGLRDQIARQELNTFSKAQRALRLTPIMQVERTREFLRKHHPTGAFTFIDLPWVNHGSASLLRDTPERSAMRKWLKDVLEMSAPKGTEKNHGDSSGGAVGDRQTVDTIWSWQEPGFTLAFQ